MDIFRKKLVVVRMSDVAGTISGNVLPVDVTDFRLRRDVLDALKRLRLSRVIVTFDFDECEYHAMLKAVEFFIFSYDKVAVSCRKSCDGLQEDLPHMLRKKDAMLSVGDKASAELLGIDYISMEDFLNGESLH